MKRFFSLPYPANRVPVKDRWDMIFNVATWEPVELSLGRYKLLWGVLLAWPGGKTYQTGPAVYGWMGHVGIHYWGLLFAMMGAAQLWANLWHQSIRARVTVMFVTEPFCLVFAGLFTITCLYHPLFWWSVGLIWYWSVVLDALCCLRRLGGLSKDDDLSLVAIMTRTKQRGDHHGN